MLGARVWTLTDLLRAVQDRRAVLLFEGHWANGRRITAAFMLNQSGAELCIAFEKGMWLYEKEG